MHTRTRHSKASSSKSFASPSAPLALERPTHRAAFALEGSMPRSGIERTHRRKRVAPPVLHCAVVYACPKFNPHSTQQQLQVDPFPAQLNR